MHGDHMIATTMFYGGFSRFFTFFAFYIGIPILQAPDVFGGDGQQCPKGSGSRAQAAASTASPDYGDPYIKSKKAKIHRFF